MDLKGIEEEISKQCQSLPRGDIALKALSHSYSVFARDMVEVSPIMTGFSSFYHAILCVSLGFYCFTMHIMLVYL